MAQDSVFSPVMSEPTYIPKPSAAVVEQQVDPAIKTGLVKLAVEGGKTAYEGYQIGKLEKDIGEVEQDFLKQKTKIEQGKEQGLLSPQEAQVKIDVLTRNTISRAPWAKREIVASGRSKLIEMELDIYKAEETSTRNALRAEGLPDTPFGRQVLLQNNRKKSETEQLKLGKEASSIMGDSWLADNVVMSTNTLRANRQLLLDKTGGDPTKLDVEEKDRLRGELLQQKAERRSVLTQQFRTSGFIFDQEQFDKALAPYEQEIDSTISWMDGKERHESLSRAMLDDKNAAIMSLPSDVRKTHHQLEFFAGASGQLTNDFLKGKAGQNVRDWVRHTDGEAALKKQRTNSSSNTQDYMTSQPFTNTTGISGARLSVPDRDKAVAVSTTNVLSMVDMVRDGLDKGEFNIGNENSKAHIGTIGTVVKGLASNPTDYHPTGVAGVFALLSDRRWKEATKDVGSLPFGGTFISDLAQAQDRYSKEVLLPSINKTLSTEVFVDASDLGRAYSSGKVPYKQLVDMQVDEEGAIVFVPKNEFDIPSLGATAKMDVIKDKLKQEALTAANKLNGIGPGSFTYKQQSKNVVNSTPDNVLSKFSPAQIGGKLFNLPVVPVEGEEDVPDKAAQEDLTKLGENQRKYEKEIKELKQKALDLGAPKELVDDYRALRDWMRKYLDNSSSISKEEMVDIDKAIEKKKTEGKTSKAENVQVAALSADGKKKLKTDTKNMPIEEFIDKWDGIIDPDILKQLEELKNAPTLDMEKALKLIEQAKYNSTQLA